MFYKLTLLLALVLTVAGCSEHINADKSLSSSASEPYVLKRGEGEELFDATWIVKASSLSGTQGGELHWVATPPGISSGLHFHVHADELFYVLSGSGIVVLSDDEMVIGGRSLARCLPMAGCTVGRSRRKGMSRLLRGDIEIT